ncbi:hypothetical protein A9P82_02390 [Arachidicoccus ginsenosidimutans]|uniref:hypothetical protein n=1 Tax=Arachidicoccus sp. BS20 TaxID=1850526 RepID=UPI0007F104DC|nr:hypothetical protein [Arachidicoccus sp. BS20]ANI88251.1 hypothetical protein A9P82_02390 [Arachidicoccus sp. BS20]
MSKRKKICIWSILVVIIILSNVPPLHILIVMGERDLGYFSYCTSKGDTTSFFTENGMEPMQLEYFKIQDYKKKYGTFPHGWLNTPLYRNFRINPLFFWHWYDYFTDERYTLPYISRQDVYKNAREKAGKR